MTFLPFPSLTVSFALQVLLGITDPELGVLDTFEDVEYERKAVEVSLVVSNKITSLLILCFLLRVLLLRLF